MPVRRWRGSPRTRPTARTGTSAARLEQSALGYVVAVPKSQQIKSLAGVWRIDQLIDDAPPEAWQRLSCGDGAKGPRIYDWAAAKLPANLIFDPDPAHPPPVDAGPPQPLRPGGDRLLHGLRPHAADVR